jgi:exo-beta-1,3-glucanase (GH17 family)
LWITSSDNFASWGGDDASYHTEDLTKLLNAVDYISLHTYPFHDTHYNNAFWKVPDEQDSLTRLEKVNAAMFRAKEHAMAQYQSAADYIKSLGVNKPIHIGETGWASESGQTFYGSNGSKATDDYKAGIYYKLIREWTNKAGMSCFYFEAFDEQWKDAKNPLGSENHFGLFGLNGEAKFAIWDYVDRGAFKGLTRDGHPIIKTFNGDKKALENEVLAPPPANELENQK